ncbi:hypothetical protein CRM22_005464 [Opisthorchis felineus]|uniref:Methylcrotonoyl-CoA carboxylase subunit alpha, mitochondrial n=1 Tax=Opisthorchis felineus TaxID=147828 RepID=A0A4S2LR23_OPIFE|nr:hypothetical protein CRM22_005464 [Opisthorchis felineus]
MSYGKISRLLIANRGEIACRIAKSAKLFGCHTVGVYSDADVSALHVKLVDEAYNVGPAPVQQSYLNIPRLISVAKQAGADAIHPGYGFLSESVEFAQACQDANLVFVGPPVSAIRDMGIKNKSKAIMASAGVPIIKGYHGEDQSDVRLRAEAEAIGFPVMIKAVRGGGGKGMRIAHTPEQFSEQLSAARHEALKAFNDDGMLIEQYIVNPRHVEVQIFGDRHGNYVYLWERDCSIQRRHQKILEEAPAPGLSPEVRKAIGEAAVAAAQAVHYVGAGTVEFVMDADQNFYFMEMNTRLQVEHPVTEAITRTDLVDWQLRVASGGKLPIVDQTEVPLVGHAFEARIYAEDCSDPSQMLPAAGRLQFLSPPPNAVTYTHMGGLIRVDSGVVSGDVISVYYDPMIAKLVAWGETREDALSRLQSALTEYRVAGLPTNIGFLRRLIQHPQVLSGQVHTGFIMEHIDTLRSTSLTKGCGSREAFPTAHCAAAIWACAEHILTGSSRQHLADPLQPMLSQIPYFRLNLPATREVTFINSTNTNTTNFRVTHLRNPSECYRVEMSSGPSDTSHSVDVRLISNSCAAHSHRGLVDHSFAVEVSSSSPSDQQRRLCQISVVYDPESRHLHTFNDSTGAHDSFSLEQPAYLNAMSGHSDGLDGADLLSNTSPMPGVIERIFVKPGDRVESGQALLTLIAMKMEYTVRAKTIGLVDSLAVAIGDTVSSGQLLVRLTPETTE